MAEVDKEDKTEDPSPRRLQQAADEGNIPMSREVGQWGALLAGTLALYIVAKPMGRALLGLINTAIEAMRNSDGSLLIQAAKPMALFIVVVAASAALVEAALMGAQTGLRFWPEKITEGFETMFDGSRLKRLFSKQMLTDLGIQMLKAAGVGWVTYMATRDEFLTLPKLLQARPDMQMTMLFAPLLSGGAKVLAILAAFAGIDFALQRRRHHEGLKMTREELKRELREEDGDPMIKSRRRRRLRELVKNRIALEVPRADALLVNPTHIAIAIRYQPGKDAAPVVTAKGKGGTAERMRELARENGVPIVEDIPLARLLFKKVKVGRTVPAETYRAVAGVLAFVYRVTGRSPSVRRVSPETTRQVSL